MFREDGYINMTKAAKAFGKQLNNFWRSPETGAYMEAMSQHIQFEGIELAPSKKGRYGGTFCHPKLAVVFARWLDVRFAVWCDLMIDNIFQGNIQTSVVVPTQEVSTISLFITHCIYSSIPQIFDCIQPHVMWQSDVFHNQPSKERTMALDLNISAPFSFSLLVSTGHLSMLCGRAERGFVLESESGKNPSGKFVEVWRNAYCGSLNVSAFGLHLIISGREKPTLAPAVA